MTKKKPPIATKALVPVELIERRIYLSRGHKVMLDRNSQNSIKCQPRFLTKPSAVTGTAFPQISCFS